MSKAKGRLVHSSVSYSERLCGLGIKAFVVFVLSVSHADDQGRLVGSARRLKGELLPLLDEVSVEDVEAALEGLEKAGLIIRYVDNKHGQLIQLSDWHEFQKLPHARDSRYPAPPGWTDEASKAMGRDSATGRFASPLKDEILGMLKIEDYSLADICNCLGMPSEKVLEVLVRLRADGIVESMDEYGQVTSLALGDDVVWRLHE